MGPHGLSLRAHFRSSELDKVPLSCVPVKAAASPRQGKSMRCDLKCIVLVVTCIGVPACGKSATASGPTGPLEFDPTALFAQLAGSYALTFEADESCPVPPSLRVLTYDVSLNPSQYRYMSVLVRNKPFVGDL